MDISTLKDWLVPVSTAGSLIAVAVGAFLSLREYKLKLRADTRLAYSAQVEADIKLLTLFTTIMNIAHARGESVVSDKLLELMTNPEILSKLPPGASLDLKDAGVITLPVGVAAQDAAIAAVCELGKKHALLRPVAIQALESLASFKGPVVGAYLEQLRKMHGG